MYPNKDFGDVCGQLGVQPDPFIVMEIIWALSSNERVKNGLERQWVTVESCNIAAQIFHQCPYCVVPAACPFSQFTVDAHR